MYIQKRKMRQAERSWIMGSIPKKCTPAVSDANRGKTSGGIQKK